MSAHLYTARDGPYEFFRSFVPMFHWIDIWRRLPLVFEQTVTVTVGGSISPLMDHYYGKTLFTRRIMVPSIDLRKSFLQYPFCLKLQALLPAIHAPLLDYLTRYGLYLDIFQWTAGVCYALDRTRVSNNSRHDVHLWHMRGSQYSRNLSSNLQRT